MCEQKLTDPEIFETACSLMKTLEKPRHLRLTDCRSQNADLRTLITTSIAPPQTSNKLCDWTPITCWAVAETATVLGYRNELLMNTAAAHIRFQLQTLYDKYALPSPQLRLGAKATITENETGYPWSDCIRLTPGTLPLPTAGSQIELHPSGQKRN
jgi:hypothetical protein